MPIIWRYLIFRFFKVFLLCTTAFVVILMTLRLNEIAHFATLGSHGVNIAWFTLQQIPYILPIAIPVSALISAILLVQNLSGSHELTAMRACGFSLIDFLTPLLATALLLSALNFYIVSELSTASHLSSGLLKKQLRSVNPLILLQSKRLMLMKGFYFDALGPSQTAELAENIILTSANRHSDRLNLMVAKKLKASPISLTGHHVTLVAGKKADNEGILEHLILENIDETSTGINDFSQIIESKVWGVNNDHLGLRHLLVRLDNQKRALQIATSTPSYDREEIAQIRQVYHLGYLEIFRRVSLAFGVFTFTLMGIAFGITISRNHSNRGTFYVIILGAMFLMAFFGAKEAGHGVVVAGLLYSIPHAVIITTSFWMLSRVNHGIE